MKRHVIIAGALVVTAVCYLRVMPLLGLSQAITAYVDQLYAAHPDILARDYTELLLAYGVIYAVTVALCLPLAALMTVIGGLLFGLTGFAVSLVAITAGSIPTFLASRRFAAPALAKTDSAMVNRFRRGFARNDFQYLIIMRLVPWAPFPVTTVLAGALGMGLTKFVAGTALGFVPAGLALNAVGHGLGHLADLRSLSFAEFLHDADFLIAVAGVGAVVALSFLRRVPVVARLLG